MSQLKKGYFKSTDEIDDIAYYIYLPEGEIKCVVQISHGMCEYIERYSDFVEYLTRRGVAVCGNDHLGHGNSVKDNKNLGYFCKDKGWQCMVTDLHKMTSIMKKAVGNDVPYIMFGHSMGSFLARAYMVKFGYELDGTVICGTSGGMNGTTGMLSVLEAVKKVKGAHFRSKRVNSLAFGGYSRKITKRRTSFDWISRDDNIVNQYNNDDKCQFIFTVNGFENLLGVLWFVSNDKWYSHVRKDMPCMLIGGKDDPVGNYGNGVQKVYDGLKNQCCNAEIKLYDDCRHELLNEINRREVYAYIHKFVCKVVNTQQKSCEGEK